MQKGEQILQLLSLAISSCTNFSASRSSLGIHADRSAIVSIHVLEKVLALLHASQEFIGSSAHGHGKHSLRMCTICTLVSMFLFQRTLRKTILIPTSQNLAVIRAPGMDTLKIPLAAEHTTIDHVSVWEWSGSAYDEGAEAAEWFSTYFGKPSRLVRFKEGSGIYNFPWNRFARLDDLLCCLWTTLLLLFLQHRKLDQPIQISLKVTRSRLPIASHF